MRLHHLRVLFWIAFFLVTIELLLEVRAVRRGWEALLLGKQVAVTAGFGPTAEFPFRSPIVPGERSAGTTRLWIASSSYAADLQLPPDQVFPNLVARYLTAAAHPAETLNASVDGHAIVNNLAELRSHGTLYRPDLVMLYQMSNDIDLIAKALVSGTLGAGGASMHAVGAADRPKPIHLLIEQTTAFKHLKSIATSRLVKGRVLRDTLGPEGEREFERVLHEFLAEARGLGARPVLCTFATSHVRASLAKLPAEYELNLLRFNMDLSLLGWLDSIERYNRILERVAREENILCVDLASVLAGRSELFRDFWHLKAPGHEIAARSIADRLLEDSER